MKNENGHGKRHGLVFFRADTGADMSRFYPRRYGQPIAPLI